jgi:hypothetical protein
MRRASGFVALGVVCALGCSHESATDAAGATQPPVAQAGYTIQLDREALSLLVGQVAIVKATVRDGRGDIVTAPAITWSSDLPGVARVDGFGQVTAVSPGSTVLRATFGGTAASILVTVTLPITFDLTGTMTTPRVGHTATLLLDGTVLVAGGSAEHPRSAETYDPTTGKFTATGDMIAAHSNHAAVLLPNGQVLIAGGDPAGAIAELYDPTSRTFRRTGDMVEPQSAQTATLLTNGNVLIAGGLKGWSDCCSIPAAPELYDPTTGVFRRTGGYADSAYVGYYVSGLIGVPATLLRDGRVLIATEPAAELYNPVSGTFSRAGVMLTRGSPTSGVPPYIAGRAAAMLSNGQVLLTGGAHEDLGRFKGAEIYDPVAGVFTQTADMAAVRTGHTATTLPNGAVLIAGGEGIQCDRPGCAVISLSTAELFGGAFTPAGQMNVAREFHQATLLKDGRVLITGGETFIGSGIPLGGFTNTVLASAELYPARK